MNLKNTKLITKLFLLVSFGAVTMIILGLIAITKFNSVKKEWMVFHEVVKAKQDNLKNIHSQMG